MTDIARRRFLKMAAGLPLAGPFLHADAASVPASAGKGRTALRG